MKPDEIYFLKRVQSEVGRNPYMEGHKLVRHIINEENFPMHRKRAWYLLEKWCDKDWYEYGTTLDLGWMTGKGMEVAA